MGKLNEAYVCHCDVPRLKKHLGEDTGICDICNLIFDEQLYWMRVQQHVKGVSGFEDLDSFLRGEIDGQAVDPHYASIATG